MSIVTSCKHIFISKNKSPCLNCNYWNGYIYFNSIHGRVNIIKPKNDKKDDGFNIKDKMFKKWVDNK